MASVAQNVDHFTLSTKPPVVAVIDDDRSILNATRRLLSTHGFDTELYDCPDKFLAAVTTTHAICLLVDIRLGPRCGIEFVRQLTNRGITFPVIFMTGDHDAEIELRARGTGCVAFFRKPFSAYLLIETLHDLPNSYAVSRPAKQ
jgi:FixJ family two-component response regulator